MAYDISAWNKPAGPATMEDLDRRAMRLLPEWAKEIVREVSTRHGVPIHQIFSKNKALPVAAARREAIYRVKFEKPSVSAGRLGQWFGRDHSTIIFALARFQELTGAPALTMRRQIDRRAA
jgi:chromosomal replication initiation ATPase DnaA